MRIWFTIGFILLLTLLNDCLGEDVHFHCERSGQHCVHPSTACNRTTGQCINCPSNFTGYDCGFNATDYTSTSCGLACQNGGTCYSNGLEELCLCTPDFYGPLCDQDRVMVTCNGENVTISVTPIELFQGKIYLGGLNPQDGCLLQPENDQNNTVYGLTLPLDTECHPYIDNDTVTGDVTYTRELTFQYDATFQSGHDLSINVTCFHSANQTREPEHTLGSPTSSKSQGGTIETLYQPAQLSVVHPHSLTPVDGVVTVGQRLTLFNFLNDDSVFKNIRVDRCVISNPSSTSSITLIANSCPTERSRALGLDEAVEHLSPPGVKHEFSMIRFGTERRVVFSCVVRMCQRPGDSTCDMTDCSANDRRKRATDGQPMDSGDMTVRDSNEQVTRTSVIVLDPNEAGIDQISGSDECMHKPTIRGLIASLASLAVLFLLLSCALAVCICRHNHNKLLGNEKPGFFSDRESSRYQEFNGRHFSESANQATRGDGSPGSGRFTLPSINVYRY